MNQAIFRIIDANFNRAREGLRIAEEFCRFALNNETLSSRCKQIRHRLSAAISSLGTRQLVTARDTENDIGRGIKITEQMKRADLEDCVTAGFARTTEAIRVLAETAATVDGTISDTLEQLRYDCYALEKDIALFGFGAIRFAKVRLYGIITLENCSDVLAVAKVAAENGADCLQLRAKKITDAAFLETAKDFVDLCSHHNVISIINDRADIAVSAQADGIHLGQNDLPLKDVRRCQLKPLITGISTHSMAELEKAIKQMPHYVGLGSVFSTDTKQQVKIAGLDYIAKAIQFLKDKPVEAVAIGGINLENIEKVLQAGARRIAVSSCICKAENPGQVCKTLKQKILQYCQD
jgi:thiamine-phosphate pyrophosphorylase